MITIKALVEAIIRLNDTSNKVAPSPTMIATERLAKQILTQIKEEEA